MSDDVEIWHGDSRVLADKIEGPIHCICTDPPYGMAHMSGSAQTAAGKKYVREIANDGDLDAAILCFLEAMAPLVAKTADDADMYVFTRWNMIGDWIKVVNQLEPFEVKNVLVWDKGTPGMGDIDANWAFSWEAIIYAKKGRRPIPERRSSIITVERTPHQHMIHPTQKPVTLIEILLKMSTRKGDLVVDPFSGSGATAVAAMNLGRRAVGIELDEFYIEPSRLRLKQGVFDL